MNYRFAKDIREHPEIRSSFNKLAQKIFGISFEQWYQDGYWTERYIPYVLLDGQTVVANISVNKMTTVWRGRQKNYIQLGTVMTDPAYRNQGLSRFLMGQVLRDWQHISDTIYLFSNDSAVNFYPKFGFERAIEYQYSCRITPKTGNVRKLDVSNPLDRGILHDCYQQSNPFAKLPMLDNEGILMFLCSSYMKEKIYYLQEEKVIVIASFEGETMFCYDIYGGKGQSMMEILSAACPEKIRTVSFGFTPVQTEPEGLSPFLEEDDTLFILQGGENLFRDHPLMFPLLSHA